jgi:8-oxo-dGTP diphosphatase
MAWMIDVVAGLVTDPQQRLLVGRRPPGKHLAGQWEFPGGKVEAGEDAATALVRELWEELRIRVVPAAPLTPVVHHYEREAIRLVPLVCRIVEGSPDPQEHSAIRWCTPAQLAGLDLTAADRPVLEEWRSLQEGTAA